MSRNLMRMALIMAATAAYAQDDIFGCSSPSLARLAGKNLFDIRDILDSSNKLKRYDL